MAVKQILDRVGSKMGLDPTNPDARSVLLAYLNEAANELYQQTDLPGSIMEMVFKVNGDQTISLPSYVGKVRGVREMASMQVWHVNKMRPRYNQFNWSDMWRNIRLLNDRAIQATVTNTSVGILSVAQIETPNVTVTLSGPTVNSTLVNETLTLGSNASIVNTPSGQLYEVQSQNAFTDYTAVKKSAVNGYDITLSDVDGKVLTVIPNNQIESIYQVWDVSACPWLNQNTSTLDNYLEVLYKKRLSYLSDDADEFPAFGFDYAIVNKMLQLWAEEQEKTEIAAAYDAKASRTIARAIEDENKDTEDMISLVAHPHDTLQKRVGTGIRRRYSLYAGRKY